MRLVARGWAEGIRNSELGIPPARPKNFGFRTCHGEAESEAGFRISNLSARGGGRVDWGVVPAVGNGGELGIRNAARPPLIDFGFRISDLSARGNLPARLGRFARAWA